MFNNREELSGFFTEVLQSGICIEIMQLQSFQREVKILRKIWKLPLKVFEEEYYFCLEKSKEENSIFSNNYKFIKTVV